MRTTEEFRDYVLEQLSDLGDIFIRPMMGEYLLYYNGTLFGGLYNNRLLIKVTTTNEKYNMTLEIPYTGAKPMYKAELDDKEKLKEIVIETCLGLPKKVDKKK